MTVRTRGARIKRVLQFFSLQSLIQLAEGLSGILIIRFLSKIDYSIYTLANTILTSLDMLSELGVSSKVLSHGGTVWNDKSEMGRLMAAYNHMRIKMGILSSIVVIPVMFFLFSQNGFSFRDFLICLLISLSTFWYIFLHRGYRLVLVLNNEVSTYQKALLKNALIRLIATTILGFIFFPFWIAFGLALVMNFGNYILLKKQARPYYKINVQQKEKYYPEFQLFVKKQIPYYGYLVLQGQLTILLITFTGEASMVADFGAISRITIIIAVINAYFSYVVYPKMAKINTRVKFIINYRFYLYMVLGIGIAMILGMFFLKDVYIWIIGEQYENIKNLLPLMTLIVAVKLLMATIYGINHAKGWIESTWVIVPTTLLTQIGMIWVLDLNTLFGILLFNLITDLPNVISNLIFSYNGIRKLPSLS